jgi:hypothetical protein
MYRKVLAPLCSAREDELPEFPRGAAIGLIIFFGFVAISPFLPPMRSPIGLSQSLWDWIVVTVFLVVGFGLVVNPEYCIRVLKWPPAKTQNASFVSRVVGAFLLFGCALYLKVQMFHR